jgi:Insertion element 4 transposase N-terminal/Transposase DDE domain
MSMDFFATPYLKDCLCVGYLYNSIMSENVSTRLTDCVSIGVLAKVFRRDLIEEVIAETNSREKRSRLLPAHLVVYYVLALALFFGEGYDEVMRKLVGGLRFLRNWDRDWKVPSTSAISQARARLGEAPMKALFERVAVPIAQRGTRGAWLGDWRVMAIDGVVIDMPDTPANNAEYRHSNGGRAPSAFPAMRVVALAECGTHAIVDAAFGTWSTGERTLADQVLRSLDPAMLLLADRGYYSYDLWTKACETGAALVFRVGNNMNLSMLEHYPDGSYRSVLLPPRTQSPVRKLAARRGDLSVLEAAGTACRVVEYTVENRADPAEVIRLITSVLDWELAPAHEIAALYHDRWEIELSFREIEIHQVGHTRVLRSKSPEMVRQEVWGILLAHYAIRYLMHEAADTADVDPDRLSFLRSLQIIRRQITRQADFSP